MALTSSPAASSGVPGMTILMPGTCAKYDSTLWECVGPARRRPPNGARMVTGMGSPVRQWCRASTLTIGSNAQEMKSANWNSTTGRNPTRAAPAARPVKPVSAIGVSTTRRGPNLSRKPLVTLKAPPNWPTSSPMMKTSGSRSISLFIASATASRYVACPLSVGPPVVGAPLVGIDALLDVARVRHRVRERPAAGGDGLLPRVLPHLLGDVGVDAPAVEEHVLEQLDGVLLGPLVVHLLRHVVGRVVLGVTVHAHGHALHDRGALTGAGPRDRLADGIAHGKHVGPVDGDPGDPVRDRLDRERLGGG